MRFKQNFYRQFGKPSGNPGRFVGWLMSVKNRDRSEWTLEKLDIQPTDKILEIGYGPGYTFKAVASKLTLGFIAGIDHSEVMLEQATRRNRKYIYEKKAGLKKGRVEDLDYPNNYFDQIFGRNVHFFWKTSTVEFRKLNSLLKPNGKLVMVFQPRWAKSKTEVKKIATVTKNQFEEAGFKNVEIDFRPMKPVTCIYVGGYK